MKDFENSMIDEIDREETNTPKATVPATVKTSTSGQPPAPPRDEKLVNPFAYFGEQEGGSSFFNGDYLRLDQKLGWIRGQDKTPVDTTLKYVTHMVEARHGYVRFPQQDGERAQYLSR
jgi:hypothetical protein